MKRFRMYTLATVVIAILGLMLGLIGCGSAATATPPAVSKAPATAAAAASAATATKAPTAAATAAPRAEPTAVASAKNLVKVKLGTVVKYGSFTPYYFAKDKGFYVQEGLDVEIVEMQSPLHSAAAASGQLDYTTVATAPEFFGPALKGLQVKAVMGPVNKPTWYLVGGPGIDSVAQLKGKAVAVTALGSFSHFSVKESLKINGLDPDKDVSYVPLLGIPERFGALKAKSIAAAYFSTPQQDTAVKEYGYKILVSIGDILQLPQVSLGTSDKKLKENPEQVKGMIRATLKALAYLRDNREESIQYLVKNEGIGPEIAQVEYQDSVSAYAFDGVISDKAIDGLLDALVSIGTIPADQRGKVSASAGIDLTLLREVLKEPRR